MKSQTNKRVLLHIGGYKTGSTAIQRYCHSHRNELEGVGIHYLTNARPKHSDSNSHSVLPGSLLKMVGEPTPKWYQDKANLEQVIANCRSEIEMTKAPAILFSSEEFAVLPLCSMAKQQVIKALLVELVNMNPK